MRLRSLRIPGPSGHPYHSTITAAPWSASTRQVLGLSVRQQKVMWQETWEEEGLELEKRTHFRLDVVSLGGLGSGGGQISISPFPSCVTLESFFSSLCLFPHLKNRDNISSGLMGLLSGVCTPLAINVTAGQ